MIVITVIFNRINCSFNVILRSTTYYGYFISFALTLTICTLNDEVKLSKKFSLQVTIFPRVFYISRILLHNYNLC